MKKFKALLLIMVITCSSVLMAGNLPPKNETEPDISKEIKRLLIAPSFDVNNVVNADVVFMVNKDHEIIVISVDTDDLRVDGFVKNCLNYKKIEGYVSSKNREYKLPIRIEPSI